MSTFDIYLFYFLWVLAFPVLAAFLISRFLGIRKGLDKWIIFFLNIVTMIGVFLPIFFIGGDYTALICIPIKIALDGIVWQIYLKDRKLNGFLCSLISGAVLFVPIIVADFIWMALW